MSSRRQPAAAQGSIDSRRDVELFSVVPFTLLVIKQTNDRLLDPSLDRGSEEARELLVQWGRLHAVRSVVGGLSFLVFIFATQR
jgi:hypothetical protein